MESLIPTSIVIMKKPLVRSAVAWAFLLLPSFLPVTAQVVFSESFETPAVSGFSSYTVPPSSRWIGANDDLDTDSTETHDLPRPKTPATTPPFPNRIRRKWTSSAVGDVAADSTRQA
jgi:hypothetical protein